MCALDLRPMSMVEGLGFKNFVYSLNPSYVVPTRNTITKVLHKIYEEAKEKVTAEMKGHPVSFTSDLWTSVANQGYISLTGHYIKDWNLYSKTLATRLIDERHSGINIAKAISDIAADFEIESIPCLVTDNAANMSVAAKEAGLAHTGCFAHTLQLCVEQGLKLNPVAKALGAARKVVAYFNRSVLATKALNDKQLSDYPKCKPKKVIQDVMTRWNSSYFMMQRLLELRVPIYAVLFDEKVTKSSDRSYLDIKDCHWQVMEQIVPILKPFADAIEVLTKEDVPTASSLYILV